LPRSDPVFDQTIALSSSIFIKIEEDNLMQ